MLIEVFCKTVFCGNFLKGWQLYLIFSVNATVLYRSSCVLKESQTPLSLYMQNANVEAQNIHFFNLCLRFNIFYSYVFVLSDLRHWQCRQEAVWRDGTGELDALLSFLHTNTLWKAPYQNYLKLIKGHILYKVRFPAIQKLWKCQIIIPLRNTHNTTQHKLCP